MEYFNFVISFNTKSYLSLIIKNCFKYNLFITINHYNYQNVNSYFIRFN